MWHAEKPNINYKPSTFSFCDIPTIVNNSNNNNVNKKNYHFDIGHTYQKAFEIIKWNTVVILPVIHLPLWLGFLVKKTHTAIFFPVLPIYSRLPFFCCHFIHRLFNFMLYWIVRWHDYFCRIWPSCILYVWLFLCATFFMPWFARLFFMMFARR